MTAKQSTTKAAQLAVDPQTSARLGRIRQHGTSAELIVRRVLHTMGLRFRVHNRDLPGSPDIANRTKRWAVFVHGCFWHRHEGCRRATTPRRNRAFWQAKFAANVARDQRALRQLRELGWATAVVWECECVSIPEVKRRLRKLSVAADV